MKKFTCVVSSPEKVVFDGEIDAVSVPAEGGTLQILADHMPLVVALAQGEVVFGDQKVSISHGILEVRDDKSVVVLVVLSEGQ